MRKVVGIACIALICLTAPALAGAKKAPQPVEPPPPPPSWNGLYVGIQGGWGSAQTAQTNLSSGVSEGVFEQDGGLIGGTAGYNWQFGNLVAGAETDLAASNISGTEACGKKLANVCTSQIQAFGTARGRLGAVVRGNTLFFVAGGLAYVDARAFKDTGLTTGDAWFTGWTVGGGVEALMTPKLSLKAEYLYSDFNGQTVNYLAAAATPVQSVERNLHIIRAGLNWHL
jgi:outer membrane immunogenic protein